jgi:hypothetical protein
MASSRNGLLRGCRVDLLGLRQKKRGRTGISQIGATSGRPVGKGSLERLYNFINKALSPSTEQRQRQEKTRLEAQDREHQKKERRETEHRTAKAEEHLEPFRKPKEKLEPQAQPPPTMDGSVRWRSARITTGLSPAATTIRRGCGTWRPKIQLLTP